jgi:aspartokinase
LETIAIYWESKIRIYGITISKGLTLIQLTIPETKAEPENAQCIQEIISSDRFLHMSGQMSFEGALQLSILLEPTMAKSFCTELEDDSFSNSTRSLSTSMVENVELLALHGPHFQDRYGIAEAAYSLLHENSIQVLASSCTGTSISLVLPPYIADTASQVLAKTFVVPKE